jgi:spore germination protein KC
MKKKIFVSIGMLLFSITLGGCWDIKYLDDLSIVAAMGIDISEGKEIELTVQVVNTSEITTGSAKGGGSGRTTVTTYSEKGQTVFEAIRKITNKTSRKLYFSHNRVLVIGEDMARKGVESLFELIERDPEIRMDFYIFVAKQAKAADILKITTPIEKIPARRIHDSIENVENNLGTAYSVTVKDVIGNMNSEKKQITMGSIEMEGDIKKGNSKQNLEKINPQAFFKLNSMAVFRDEKLIGFFDPMESRGNSWIQDKINNTIIKVPCNKKGNVVIEIVHSSTDMKMKLQQGQRVIVIHIKQEANIGENLCPGLDVSDKKTIADLEKRTQEQIKKEILASVKQAKKWKSDVFGFGKAVYKSNPVYWKENKDNWKEVFSQIPVQIKVETEIRREGTRNRSYYKKVD